MQNSTISTMNTCLRPYRSATPPNAEAPIRDAEQRGRGDDALLGRTQAELPAHERQGDAGGKDHHTFEKLAGGGQSPDQPLHSPDQPLHLVIGAWATGV